MEKIKLVLLAMAAVGILLFGVAQLLESRYYLFPRGEGSGFVALDRWTGEIVIASGGKNVRIPLAGGKLLWEE